jgi:hypothetical protein
MFNRLIGIDKNFHDRFKDSYTTNVRQFEYLNILIWNGLVIFTLVIVISFLRIYLI